MAGLYSRALMPGQESSNGVLRCVIVVDESLPPGLAANATAMLAVTLGATVAGLPGAALVEPTVTSTPASSPRVLRCCARPPTASVICGHGPPQAKTSA